VTVDLTEGSQIILSGGVKAGDVIVIDGQEKLRNGSRVVPRQASNPNGPRAMNPNRADTGVGAPSTRDQEQPKSEQQSPDRQAQPARTPRAGGQQP
jgi:multidrug efflux system membrane fusion protein